MATDLSSYINFGGKAREALEFYQTIFGGELSLERYGDYGISEDPAEADKIIYGVLHSPDGFVMRGTDNARSCGAPAAHEGWALCLNGDNRELLTRCWKALADTATIIEPMTTAAWGDSNGVLKDRFGITWIVNIGTSK